MHRDRAPAPRAIAPVLLAGLLVLAGCSAALGGSPGATPGGTDGRVAVAPPAAGDGAPVAAVGTNAPPVARPAARTPDDGGGAPANGTDDRLNTIDDFERLTVIVTGVTFERVDGPPVAFDVAAQTVDLARLHGQEAALVDSSRVPPGLYTGAVIDVAEVTGTLETGEPVGVRLPGGTLRVEEAFAVERGEPVEFAFDVTVVRTEGDGYVLAPVVSGASDTVATGRPAASVLAASDRGVATPATVPGGTASESGREPGDGDAADDGTGPGDRGSADRRGAGERTGGPGTGDLDVEFDGGTSPGETLLVSVTRGDEPVSGAAVTVGDETRRTNRFGTVAVAVPDGVPVLAVEVEHGGERVELVREFADPHGTDGRFSDGATD